MIFVQKNLKQNICDKMLTKLHVKCSPKVNASLVDLVGFNKN